MTMLDPETYKPQKRFPASFLILAHLAGWVEGPDSQMCFRAQPAKFDQKRSQPNVAEGLASQR